MDNQTFNLKYLDIFKIYPISNDSYVSNSLERIINEFKPKRFNRNMLIN